MKNNIRHIREFKGYSQKYIAKRLGKSQAAISKIENGNTHLSDKAIEQLCKILEVTEEEILTEEIKGAKALHNQINHLYNQITENKKLLHEVPPYLWQQYLLRHPLIQTLANFVFFITLMT